jgi:hypothetical protein
MKKLAFLLIVIVGTAFSEWVDFGMDEVDHAIVSIVESNPDGMIIDVTVPGIGLSEITESGLDFTMLNIPGATMSALEPGYPQLPKVSFLAALPSDPSITFTVESMKTVEIGEYTPYPMQPVQLDNATEPPPFTYLPSAYQAGSYPIETAQCKVDGILRGVTVGRFAINPVVWDSSTGQLSVCCNIRVRIDFGGTVTVDERLYSRFFEPTYRQVLINADILGEPARTSHISSSGPRYASSLREARAIDAADLLIIAGDDFVDSMMDEFVTAKYEQGYLPAVVAAGTWSYTEIRDYIQDAYDNWTIPPSFVLLVGDGPELTAYNSGGMWGDNRYACVDGSDYMADIYHGRFATPTDFYPNIEEKQLKWQFDPLMDPDFWNNVLCAGMLEVSGTVSNRWFLYTCETVHDTYEDIYGKTAARVYVTNASASPPYYYNPGLPSNGEMIPAEITYDGTTQDIIDSFNDGVFLVQHRDHGGVSGWADPPFHTSDLTNLTNGLEAPVVFSFNCLTGQFHQNLCFAESLQRMEGGATAVVAACASSYSYFNDYIVFGCYMSFNDDYVSPPFSYTSPSGGYLAGQMMMNGKLEMQAAAPFNPYTSSGWESYAEDEWDLFMVFGDPTMDMRTEVPEQIDVVAPATLPSGSSEAYFQVSTPGRGAVPGALVCLSKASDSLYATGITDSTGSVTLEFDAIGALEGIQWMVTVHNGYPERGFINGTGITGEPDAAMFSVGSPFPNPGSSLTFPVTVSSPGNFELTIYDLSGRAVETLYSGELSEGSHELIWNGTCNESHAPAGIYMARYFTPDGAGEIHKVILLK